MKQRTHYLYHPGEKQISVSEGVEEYHLGGAAPILSSGDLMGCVMLLLPEDGDALEQSEQMLLKTAAGFLGKQMEQ